MVSIKLKFRASSKAGKEGSLYYQVIYNRMVRQISTPHKIFTEEWNPDIEDLIIKLEKPCARAPRSPVPLTLAVQNSLTL